MFDNKNCLRDLEYDLKYSDMINKYELELDNKLNRDSINFKGVEYEVY